MLVVVAIACYQLLWPPWYRFPESRPFRGERWYNPYEGSSGTGLRCNFHAHTECWNGLTSGDCSRETVSRIYRERGYDVAAITNYQSISPPTPTESLWIPAYEHGYGLGLQHQTVLGAPSVTWFDYPFGQGRRQKQHVLDVLQRPDTVLIVNHPEKGQGYAPEDLAALGGFVALEVATRHSEDGRACWDAALSAGRPIWGVCSDDGHHPLKSANHVELGWNVAQARERSAQGVLEALRHGRFYAVWDFDREGANALLSCEIEGGVLSVKLQEAASRIEFIGQGGRILRTVHGKRSARYSLALDDTYVRVEARNRSSTLFLNPVYRYRQEPFEGRVLPQRRALATWAGRGFGLLLTGWALVRCARGRTRRAPAPAGGALVPAGAVSQSSESARGSTSR